MIYRILKYLSISLALFVGLLFSLVALFYVPPMQKAFVQWACIAFSDDSTHISVGDFSLRFPLHLNVLDAVVVCSGDTMCAVGRFHIDVSLMPLVRMQAFAPELSAQNVLFNMDDSTGFAMNISVRDASIHNAFANLSREEVTISSLQLSGGKIYMRQGRQSDVDVLPSDTTLSVPLAWTIGVDTVTIDDVVYELQGTYAESFFTAQVSVAGIEHTSVDLARQDVDVDNVMLRAVSVAYLTDSMVVVPPTSNAIICDTLPLIPSMPWTVSVQRIDLDDSEVLYGESRHEPLPGFDTEFIQLSNVNISLDTLYNRGTEVSAHLTRLSLQERSGLAIRRGEVDFMMDSVVVQARNLIVETDNSSISADIYADASLLSMDSKAAISADIDMIAGLADLLIYDPDISCIIDKLPFDTVLFDTHIGGTLDTLSLHRLYAEMPHYADMLLQGMVQSSVVTDSLSASLDIAAHLHRLGFVAEMLPDSLAGSIAIPDSIQLTASADFVNNCNAEAQLLLSLPDGDLSLVGAYLFPDTSYSVELDINRFPLCRFLPRQTLGMLSMSLLTAGTGYNPYSTATSMRADICIDTLEYASHTYRNIHLDAVLDNGNVTGRIASNDDAVMLDINLSGTISADKYAAVLTGVIEQVDLKTLHFADDSITIASQVDIRATADTSAQYTFTSNFDDVRLHLLDADARYDSICLAAVMKYDSLDARLQMPGVGFSFSSSVGVDTFLARVAVVSDTLQYAVDHKKIAPQALCDALPPYKMRLSIVPEQLVEKFLADNGVKIDALHMLSYKGRNEPFLFMTELQHIDVSSMLIDTLRFDVAQSNDSVVYALKIENTPETSDILASASVSGYIASQEVAVMLQQQNQGREQSLQLGLDAFLYDSLVHVAFVPENPTLGTPGWSLNKHNFVDYYFDGRLAADLLMKHGSQSVSLQSGAVPGADTVYLDIRNLNLNSILQTFPGMPPLKSRLSTHVAADFSGRYPSVDGYISLDSMVYNRGYVGDIRLAMKYSQPSSTLLKIASTLSIDSLEAVSLALGYDTDTLVSQPINASVYIPGIPLRIANAFAGDDVLQMSGMLTGDVQVKGRMEKPQIEGVIKITDSDITVPMIGAKYTLSSPSVLSMHGDKACIDTFAICGPNMQPLSITGNINLSDFARPYVDAAVHARDFQLFDVKKNKTSILYGEALADIDLSARGYTDDLLLRGDVELLNGTEATYVLRDNNSLPGVSDYGDMVTFTSFADTLTDDNVLPMRRVAGMDMLVNVDVGNAVDLSVELTPDGNSYIDLQGGGSLTYAMNNLGDNRFTGRYELSGGTVCYTPPLIGEKLFTIKEGSSVVWKSDIANPTIDITAIDKLDIVVTSGNASRNVQFNVSIAIVGNLEHLSIVFDAEAPGDMAIQNELSAMTAEQRASQAMSLLIYNMYTGPGASSQGDIFSGNPLNQFLQNELNKWSRNNLKGVDLSFGISSTDEVDGTTHTDYSYKLSKKLFNDRIRIVVGGSYSPDDNSAEALKQNLVEDIALEYFLDKRDNMLLKIFRHTGQESILEGEITKTGVGFAVRKKLSRLADLFRRSSRKTDKNK